jgi:hypothetical protein
MRKHRAWKIVGAALAATLAIGLLPSVADASGDDGPADTTGDEHPAAPGGDTLARVRELFAARPDLRARLARTTARATSAPVTAKGGVSASATTLSVADPGGDSASRSDIRAVGARLTTTSLRLSIRVPGASNPSSDPKWVGPNTGALWAIDSGGDGSVERLAVIFPDGLGGLIGFVVGNTTNPNLLCAGNATFENGGNVSIQIPSACVGSPSQITFGAEFDYDYRASAPTHRDFAPDGDAMAGPITAATTAPSVGGGELLGSGGGVYGITVNGPPPGTVWTEYGSIATPRNIAVTPDGGHGYVLAGSGRLFGISFGRNDLPPRVVGAKSWPGQNVARAVAIRPNGGSGLVADGFGNLYPFSIGSRKAAPTLVGVPKWPGVDVVRGIAVMPNGKGGFTLDAFGGLHWFSIGSSSPAPTIIGAASFPGSDMARGVSILPDGTGGFVVDRNGGMHFFSIGTARTAPNVSGNTGFPTDVFRGVGILTRLVARP